MNRKIGLVGVGVMGEPIARNIHQAGHEVHVFNRTPARCSRLQALGVNVAPSASAVFEACDVIVLMVPSQSEVEQVLQATATGGFGVPVRDKVIVLMATVAPAYSFDLAERLEAAGARYVEAPVSGSKVPAENAQLVVLAAAAKPSHLDAVQPLFDAIGKKTVRCGLVPMAMRTKLANQLLLISWFEAMSEATHFAQSLGLDVAAFLEMVQAGPLGNDALRSKLGKLASNDFLPQAAIRHVAKDIGLVCAEAQRLDVWVPIAIANRALFDTAMQAGLADSDAIGILTVLRNGALA